MYQVHCAVQEKISFNMFILSLSSLFCLSFFLLFWLFSLSFLSFLVSSQFSQQHLLVVTNCICICISMCLCLYFYSDLLIVFIGDEVVTRGCKLKRIFRDFQQHLLVLTNFICICVSMYLYLYQYSHLYLYLLVTRS